MRDNILSRLAALEARKPDCLRVLCCDQQGNEQIMTVNECIANGYCFIRVCSGSDLSDLDKLLEYTIQKPIKNDT